MNYLAKLSNINLEHGTSEPYLLTHTPSSTIRLVGLDLEFFKDKRQRKLNPCQIGLCYYDVVSGAVGTRIDVLINRFINQPEGLELVDWNHANRFIGIDNAATFEERMDISFADAMQAVIKVCEAHDFYFVGHSIANDIIGMKLHAETGRIIDTAVVYSSHGQKPSLSTLAAQQLEITIQQTIHPPLEDAYIPIEIVLKMNPGEYGSPPAGNQTWQATLPSNLKGKIIGQQGRNISFVRSQSQATITVGDGFITVNGSVQNAERAKGMLDDLAETPFVWTHSG